MNAVLLYVVVGLCLIPALLWTGFRVYEWRCVFRPRRALVSDPGRVGLLFRDVDFIAEDGTLLHGWWIPHDDARGTILHLHGSAGNMGDRVETLRDLHELGMHVFTFDYRGYGRSRGIASERGTYRDSRAAFEVVRSQYDDADEPPVVVYARSLGAAVGIRLAGDRPVRGLVVEATFTSIPDLGAQRHRWIPSGLPGRIRYDSISRVPHLRIPTLFAHSTEDALIPFEHGRRLYEAAATPKQFVELRGDHGTRGWQATPGYRETLKAFVQRAVEPPR